MQGKKHRRPAPPAAARLPPSCFEELSASHLQELLALRSQIVLLRIGGEAMTTQAACRTYNTLVAEERRVAATLLLA